MKFFILILLSFFLSISLTAQNNQTIIKLETKLKSISDKEKSLVCLQLSDLYKKVNNSKSNDYANQAYQYAKLNNQPVFMAKALNNMAYYQLSKKDYKKAVERLDEQLIILQKLNDPNELANVYYELAMFTQQSGNEKKATEYYEKSLEFARKQNIQNLIHDNYRALFNNYYDRKKYDKAIDYFRLYIAMEDSLKSLNYSKEKTDLEMQIETHKAARETLNVALLEKDSTLNIVKSEKETLEVTSAIKDTIIETLNYEKAYKETIIRQQQQRQNYLLLISLILLASVIGAVYSYSRIRKANKILAVQKKQIEDQNEELNQQNEEIAAQRDEIEKHRDFVVTQRDEIAAKNRHITESIHYAYRIQSALIPPQEFIASVLPEYFILYKPRDIVSGDFYWVSRKIDADGNQKTLAVVADCTGHGVPGAFMSMLGISFLNEIVNEENILQADDILNHLRADIIKSLHQTGKVMENKDGMDISLCIIDQKNNEIEFAGAHNPLYIIRNGELIIIDADNMPVAIYQHMNPFSGKKVPVQKGDCLYMTTDGYEDQFGGEKGKKFLKKQLKQMLTQVYSKPMKEQNIIFDETIEKWKSYTDSHGQPYQQVDDILLMGIRI